MDLKLQISTDEQVISPLCDFTFSWCLNCGLSEKEAQHFTIAVSELITDIILFAYPNDSQAKFEIDFKYHLSNVELVVSEVGEPFDPDRHRYDPERAQSTGDFEGAGFRLIRRFSDEFLFINKGKEGKEFHLTKKISVRDIDEDIERSRTEEPANPQKSASKRLQAKHFKYHRIKPADAEDIAKLIYRTYGYTYTKEDLYFPKKIEKTLLGKEKLGIITKNKNGKAIGYFAVLKKKDSNIGEVGEAVVSPNYRKLGIMNNMMEHLIEIAEKNELLGLYGKAVTLHPVSQRVNCKYGFKTTALMAAESDKIRYKGFNEQYPQPVSVVIDFLPLFSSVASKPIYPPENYKEIILDTYRELGISVTPKPSRSPKMAEKSNIQVNINYADSTALLIVKKYGPDFHSVLSEMLKSMDEQENLNAIYIDLPLENSATPEQYQYVKKMDFIYSGLAPLFHEESDYLRLQKIILPVDFNLIEIFSDFGNEIKSFIADEYHKYSQVRHES